MIQAQVKVGQVALALRGRTLLNNACEMASSFVFLSSSKKIVFKNVLTKWSNFGSRPICVGGALPLISDHMFPGLEQYYFFVQHLILVPFLIGNMKSLPFLHFCFGYFSQKSSFSILRKIEIFGEKFPVQIILSWR